MASYRITLVKDEGQLYLNEENINDYDSYSLCDDNVAVVSGTFEHENRTNIDFETNNEAIFETSSDLNTQNISFKCVAFTPYRKEKLLNWANLNKKCFIVVEDQKTGSFWYAKAYKNNEKTERIKQSNANYIDFKYTRLTWWRRTESVYEEGGIVGATGGYPLKYPIVYSSIDFKFDPNDFLVKCSGTQPPDLIYEIVESSGGPKITLEENGVETTVEFLSSFTNPFGRSTVLNFIAGEISYKQDGIDVFRYIDDKSEIRLKPKGLNFKIKKENVEKFKLTIIMNFDTLSL